MHFKFEMIIVMKEALTKIKAKVNKEQDINYELLRGLYMDSKSSGQGKAKIGVTVMHENFTNFIEKLIGMNSSHKDRIFELQKLDGCVYVATKEVQD